MAGNFLRDKDIVIIAYGEIKNELRSGKTAPELASEAMEEVFRWSGLTNRDIDGLAINFPPPRSAIPFIPTSSPTISGSKRAGCSSRTSAVARFSATSRAPPLR